MITVAINAFDGYLPGTMESLIANQAIVADALDGLLDLQFYFSEQDAIRVANDVVERTLRICEEYPHSRHLFIVAPFGPTYAVTIACMARRAFLRHCKQSIVKSSVEADILHLPTSQYVSLYSRGHKTPHVFVIQPKELDG